MRSADQLASYRLSLMISGDLHHGALSQWQQMYQTVHSCGLTCHGDVAFESIQVDLLLQVYVLATIRVKTTDSETTIC